MKFGLDDVRNWIWILTASRPVPDVVATARVRLQAADSSVDEGAIMGQVRQANANAADPGASTPTTAAVLVLP